MAVFRVERNAGYTVMSNHHLRNKNLTLKAKGLLSQMLSLPEDWDFTLAGLSYINREKIDAKSVNLIYSINDRSVSKEFFILSFKPVSTKSYYISIPNSIICFYSGN